MEHDEALERIEIAAAEPEGLERLMAGDTAEAAAVAGHLAGCAACTAELAAHPPDGRDRPRGRRKPSADPELRERTLAFVRRTGVRAADCDRAARRGRPAVRCRARRRAARGSGALPHRRACRSDALAVVPRAGSGRRSRCSPAALVIAIGGGVAPIAVVVRVDRDHRRAGAGDRGPGGNDPGDPRA